MLQNLEARGRRAELLALFEMGEGVAQQAPHDPHGLRANRCCRAVIGGLQRGGGGVTVKQARVGADHDIIKIDVRGAPAVDRSIIMERSEERRVGKECVSTCRSRWSPYH